MPVTILSIQENKPCHFYTYTSLASTDGRNRFYYNEYKPTSFKAYKEMGNQYRGPGIIRENEVIVSGCRVSKGKKAFSTRF